VILGAVNPRTITVDKNGAYPKATAEMKKDGELWRRSRLRQVKYLKNIVGQDNRNVRVQATFIAGLFQVAA
jgi:transposase, IS6 family